MHNRNSCSTSLCSCISSRIPLRFDILDPSNPALGAEVSFVTLALSAREAHPSAAILQTPLNLSSVWAKLPVAMLSSTSETARERSNSRIDRAYAGFNCCGRLVVAIKGACTSIWREALSRTVHGSNCACGSPPATSVFDWTVVDPMLLAYSVGTAAF